MHPSDRREKLKKKRKKKKTRQKREGEDGQTDDDEEEHRKMLATVDQNALTKHLKTKSRLHKQHLDEDHFRTDRRRRMLHRDTVRETELGKVIEAARMATRHQRVMPIDTNMQAPDEGNSGRVKLQPLPKADMSLLHQEEQLQRKRIKLRKILKSLKVDEEQLEYAREKREKEVIGQLESDLDTTAGRLLEEGLEVEAEDLVDPHDSELLENFRDIDPSEYMGYEVPDQKAAEGVYTAGADSKVLYIESQNTNKFVRMDVQQQQQSEQEKRDGELLHLDEDLQVEVMLQGQQGLFAFFLFFGGCLAGMNILLVFFVNQAKTDQDFLSFYSVAASPFHYCSFVFLSYIAPFSLWRTVLEERAGYFYSSSQRARFLNISVFLMYAVSAVATYLLVRVEYHIHLYFKLYPEWMLGNIFNTTSSSGTSSSSIFTSQDTVVLNSSCTVNETLATTAAAVRLGFNQEDVLLLYSYLPFWYQLTMVRACFVLAGWLVASLRGPMMAKDFRRRIMTPSQAVSSTNVQRESKRPLRKHHHHHHHHSHHPGSHSLEGVRAPL